MGLKLRDLPPHVQALIKAQDAKGDSRPDPMKKRAGVPNKLEGLFMRRLELMKLAGEVVWFAFEPFALRLGERCTYTPDFIVIYANGETCVEETKGYEREDAIVKFKAAADRFPHWRFRMWKQSGGGWNCVRDLNGN